MGRSSPPGLKEGVLEILNEGRRREVASKNRRQGGTQINRKDKNNSLKDYNCPKKKRRKKKNKKN